MTKLDDLDTITLGYFAQINDAYLMLERAKGDLPTAANWWDDNFPYSIYRDNINLIQRLINSLLNVSRSAYNQAVDFANKEAKYEKTDAEKD
nr:MAG TPA: hypothetical protein [Caudoviricetes sp.]